MLASLSTYLSSPEYLFGNPLILLALAFQIWMFVDSLRKREYVWSIFIFFFSVITAVIYFFLIYRAQPATAPSFEIPGAHNRKRIRDLQNQIHHLDKAHHHAELADIYFQQGKIDLAEKSYRDAYERDSADPDIAAHYGECLLRKGDFQKARELLEQVVRENPRHAYGSSMMAYAEALARLGENEAAIAAWKSVLETHSYSRARVQLAELYLERGERELARKQLEEVIDDDQHAAAFQRKQDRGWVNKARALLKQA